MNPLAWVTLAAVLSIDAGVSDDKAILQELEKAVQTLNQLYAKGDVNAIRGLITVDHVAITPYYGGPQNAVEQLKNLSDTKLTEYVTGKVQLTMLAKDVALVSYPITLKGTHKGTSVSGKYHVGAVWVKRDTKWLEAFYQESPVKAAPKPAGGAKQDANAVEKQLLTLERNWAKALEKRDAKVIEPLLAKDFISIEPDGSVLNKEQYIEARLKDPVLESCTIDMMQVRVFGNAATVMGLQTNRDRVKGEKVTTQYRFLDVWVMQDGAWKCVSTQETPLPAKK